ncbi:MAG: putative phage tail protein [Clostridium sp.]
MDKVEAILKQIPSFIKKDEIMREIYSIQGQTFNELDDKTRNTFEQLFIDTATWGLRRWEEMLGINVDLSKSDEDRRVIIKSKLIGSKTTTKELLLEFLGTFGYTDVALTENMPDFTQTFDINHYLNTNTSKAMMETLRDIFPAHLQGVLNFKSDTSIVEYINPNTAYVSLNNPQEMHKQIADIRLDRNGTLISFMNVESDNEGKEVILDYMVVEPTESKLKSVIGSISNSPAGQTTEWGGYTRKVSGSWSTLQSHYGYCTSSGIAGDSMEWSFEGNHIVILGMRNNDLGMVRVSLDGKEEAIVDLYNPSLIKDVAIFEKKGLSRSVHTIKIEAIGSKHPSSNGTKIVNGGIKYHAYRERMDLYNNKEIEGNEYLNGKAVLMDLYNEEFTLSIEGCNSAKLFGKVSPRGGLVAINTAHKDKIGYKNDTLFGKQNRGTLTNKKKTFIQVEDNSSPSSQVSSSNFIVARDFDTGVVKWKTSLSEAWPFNYSQDIFKCIVDKDNNVYIVTEAYHNTEFSHIMKFSNNGAFINRVAIQNTNIRPFGDIVYNKLNDKIYISFEQNGLNNTIYVFNCSEFPKVTLIKNDFNKITESAPEVNYHSGSPWNKVYNSKCLNGMARESSSSFCSVTFTFTGTGFSWYTLFGPENGIAKITIDNGTPIEVDTYSEYERVGVGYLKTGLADKKHIVKIDAINKKNSSSSGIKQVIDYFTIEGQNHKKMYRYLLGEIDGDIYGLETYSNYNQSNPTDTMYMVKYDSDMFTEKRVTITPQYAHNFIVGDSKFFMSIKQPDNSIKVTRYTPELVVDVNKISPIGMDFLSEGTNIVGIKQATFEQQVDIMQLDDRFNEEWTTTFTRNLMNRDEYEWFFRLFIDKDGIVRLGNKQSAGFKKRLTIF